MRVLVAGFQHETNSFANTPVTGAKPRVNMI